MNKVDTRWHGEVKFEHLVDHIWDGRSSDSLAVTVRVVWARPSVPVFPI
ncbi:MAG: hypothetical protein OXT74_16890 [Candidatus Poribacteria bacterium]|nr:hypothetical protein [Candidatus Poribacteria bacterium]